MRELEAEFLRLLESQQIRAEDLDYSLLEGQRALLNQLAEATNSGITVFDHSTQRHVFSSDNCHRLFGSDAQDARNNAGRHFRASVHPEDIEQLTRNGIAALQYFLHGEGRDLMHTKMISEYRILVAGQFANRVGALDLPLAVFFIPLPVSGALFLFHVIFEKSPENPTKVSID